MDLGDGELACLKCGSVFISKRVREELTPDRIKWILQAQEAEEAEVIQPGNAGGKTSSMASAYFEANYELKAKQEESDSPPNRTHMGFVAPCGFEAKTKAGKVNHQKHCGKCGEVAS
jgi:hypothetical protein